MLAAQQHLQVNPDFVEHLRLLTGASSVVTLVDESDLVLQPFARRVARRDIERFARVIADLEPDVAATFDGAAAWAEKLTLFTRAAIDDLREGDWTMPRPPVAWVLAVQRSGRDRFGAAFRYVGFDLYLFGRSDPLSRGRDGAGDLTFAAAPQLGDEAAVFTGSIATGLVRHRLDPDRVGRPLSAPLDGLRFENPGTRWFNLNDRAGSAAYFPGYRDRILDFFARLIARNIMAGKRTLLVARKRFREVCRRLLTQKLDDLGVGPVSIVTGDWDGCDLSDPRTLPLITYGVSGVNRFEEYDAAYCLTGYYVAPSAVENLVNDLEAPANYAAVGLGFTGTPARRSATIDDPALLNTVVPDLARWALAQKEADVVVQAVGRVRPFTRPREVITFQAGALPGVSYAAEFTSLGEARAFLEFPTPRAELARELAERAKGLRRAGLTRAEIAAELGVSLASVKRYLKCPAPPANENPP